MVGAVSVRSLKQARCSVQSLDRLIRWFPIVRSSRLACSSGAKEELIVTERGEWYEGAQCGSVVDQHLPAACKLRASPKMENGLGGEP